MLWQEIFMNLFTRQSGTLFSKTHPTTIVCQRPAKAPSSARLTSYWCLSCSWWWYGDDDNSNGDEKMIRIIILREKKLFWGRADDKGWGRGLWGPARLCRHPRYEGLGWQGKGGPSRSSSIIAQCWSLVDQWWCFVILLTIFLGSSTAGLKYGTLERDGATADQGLEWSRLSLTSRLLNWILVHFSNGGEE